MAATRLKAKVRKYGDRTWQSLQNDIMPRVWHLRDDEEQQQQHSDHPQSQSQPQASISASANIESEPVQKPRADIRGSENTPLLVGGSSLPTTRRANPSGAAAANIYSPPSRLGYYRQHPHRVVRWPAEFYYVAYSTLVSNYVNAMLVFVPLGIVSGVMGWNSTLTFSLNFLAIVPLASLLSFATEELSAEMGDTLGGLLNATFGNAVELIVSIIALKNNEIRVVQASMLGSILSNMLLVLGCCFFVGGLRFSEQYFNTTVASTMSSLMAVASASLIIPAALNVVDAAPEEARKNVLFLSRGTAIILFVLYIMYLIFQLRTHTSLFEPSPDSASGEEPAEEAEERILSPISATVALFVITLAVAVCAEYLVDSIDSLVETTGISKTFIGLILLPIVGNAAEHVTAVVVAYKNKMDLAIGVALGSSMQIALFVTPFLVIVGWAMGREMTLFFHTFETITFFISMLVVTLLVMDGKSNYLEGGLCLGMYLIIALAFYVYPDHAQDIGASQPWTRF